MNTTTLTSILLVLICFSKNLMANDQDVFVDPPVKTISYDTFKKFKTVVGRVLCNGKKPSKGLGPLDPRLSSIFIDIYVDKGSAVALWDKDMRNFREVSCGNEVEMDVVQMFTLKREISSIGIQYFCGQEWAHNTVAVEDSIGTKNFIPNPSFAVIVLKGQARVDRAGSSPKCDNNSTP